MSAQPMELLLRKYFWSVQLTGIALAALLAAKIVNLFIEASLAPAPAPPAAAVSARPAAAAEPPAALDAERLARLTGLTLPAEPSPEEGKADLSSDPVRTSMRVKLLGTLLAGPEWSLASVLDLTSQKALTVMVGDRLLTSQVLQILRDRVIVLNNGRREYVSAEAGDGAPPLATTTKVTEPAGAWGAGIKQLDDNSYDVPRSELDRAINNLNDLAMQARLVPAFKDGVAEGFKLFSIRPDSLYSKIGIVNGDVVKRINGFEMNDPAKALEVYTKLKDAPRVDVEIDRNGTTVRKTYNIH
ncbi:MAG TPA: type II secretion system protein GspC [Myxococcaceae bacterium]|nr:type II secretion system protein GspC [Myxococcaceae bacterium]